MTAPPSEPARSVLLLRRLAWMTLCAVVAITPLVISLRGYDVFRQPKTLFLQAGVLIVAALVTASALLSEGFAKTLQRRKVLLFAPLAVLWTIIVSATSLVPEVSRGATFTVFCYALLFWLSVELSRDNDLRMALGAVLLPAVVNAVIVLLQATSIWQPFEIMAGPEKLGNIGLIGNPNTAGTYLLVPTLFAIGGAVALRRFRPLLIGVSLLLLVATFQTQTLAVIISLVVGLLALAATSGRNVRRAALALVIVAGVAFGAYGPTRQRATTMVEIARAGDYPRLTSWRLPTAVTTFSMFASRPLTGIGPGVFKARYMEYRMALDERFPEWMRPIGEPYQQAHNDHLQLLAEGGLPAYLLFVSFLVAVGRITWRSTKGSEGSHLARAIAFPIAAAFATLTLGQFPLDLGAPVSAALFIAGIFSGWSCDARS